VEHGQLHHVEYYVDNLKESNQFWNWFLGFLGYRKTSEWNEGVSWTHPNGTYLVFVQTSSQFREVRNNRRASGLNHIAFVWNSGNGLDGLEQALIDRGVKFLEKDEDHLCFEDVNQFAVEVFLAK
jgi:catechol 2,3-dioxygenase-like lactoylglutathione lyase family enzyme